LIALRVRQFGLIARLFVSDRMGLSHRRYPDEVDKKKAAVLAAAHIGLPPATAPEVALQRCHILRAGKSDLMRSGRIVSSAPVEHYGSG
jgi:hypothetical protein